MDYAFRSAVELAAAIRSREISAEELLEHYLARGQRFNDSLNAIVAFDLEGARARAREADAAFARGEVWGPLHGVPMTVKDCFEVVGMPTTAGALSLKEHRPKAHAAAVQRLLAAGAIIFGKTNVPLYARDLQSYNDVYGVTRNPWDPDRTPGGSSGGAAAALAAGLTGFELGSDIGGSIRTPSAFCGVCGHKPSYGVVSVRGHIPGEPGSLTVPDIGVAGPMGRRVADLELGLDLLAGPDPEEAVGWRLELPPPRKIRLKEFRVAAWLDDPACPVDAEIVATLETLVEELQVEGVAVDAAARPAGVELESSHALYYGLLAGALSPGLPERTLGKLRELAEEGDSSDYAIRFARGSTQSHAAWLHRHEQRQQLRERWREFFQRFDVLIAPVVQTLPFPHDHSEPMGQRRLIVNDQAQPYMDILKWVGLAGGVYLSATVVPVARSRDGLPIAVQVIGPYLEDRTALAFAPALETLRGGFLPPPEF